MSIILRTVCKNDASSIVDLLNPIIEAGIYTIMPGPVTLLDQIAFIEMLPARSIFNAAVDDATGTILGIQDILPLSPESPALHHVGEVSTFIRMGRHRNGIGRRLAQVSFADARDNGFRKIRATIRSDNTTALAFYQGLGFVAVGTAREHAHVNGRYLDEVIAEKPLM